MNKRALISITATLSVGFAAVIAIRQYVNWNTPAQRFHRAIVVEHSNFSSDEFGDYGHITIGRIKDIPIEELAEILKLPSHTTKPIRDVEPDASGWHLFPELEWWYLPNHFDEVYYDLGTGYQCLLGRDGDRVFLQDLTW